jgi:protein TorT
MFKPYRAVTACSIIALGLLAMLGGGPIAAGPSARVFCVLVPHFKDEYWLSVGYGLEQEAARQNVTLLVYEAGGYRASDQQIQQLDDCGRKGVDAILLGAVSSSDPDLIAAIARIAQDIPVFGLVNELHSSALRATIGVDWQDIGAAIGQHLTALHPSGAQPKTAVLISGPVSAGWTGPLENGLRAGLATSEVDIVEVFGDDTGLAEQLALVEAALDRHPAADYVIGTAPAIEATIGVIAARTPPTRPLLISTYISHSILRGLQNGNILAAAFDDPMLQGVMAVRRAASGEMSVPRGENIGPDIVLLRHGDANLQSLRLSPADYFPALQ